MSRISLRPFLIIGLLLFSSSILTTSTAQKKNNVKISFDIKGNEGVLLKVEIEYAINRKGSVTNEGVVKYSATNIGTIPYTWGKKGDKNQMVFELTTSDGKTIEVAKPFYHNLQPGNSSEFDFFIADVGIKRFCTAIKVIRLDSIN